MSVEPEVIGRVRALLASARHAPLAHSGAHAGANPLRSHAAAAQAPSRSVQIHEIRRISRWYGWDAEIAHALALAGARALTALDDPALAALLARMQQLEACIQHGLGPPDAPPA